VWQRIVDQIELGHKRVLIITIHLLGLAQRGIWLHRTAARRATSRAWCKPNTIGSDGCHAVPFNLLTRQGEKNSAEEKITTQVLGGLPFETHVPVCPEPPPDRKPPALLAACLRVCIGVETFVSGISCPFLGFEAFAS
jgi:hypothetical protein